MADILTPSDAVKLFVSNLQKKQRNLVKRKGKLDHYKELLSKGEVLNEEQKKAVEGYEGVLQSITVVQEVMTQSKELMEDVESAVRYCDKQAEESREEHTINFMRTHVCLMQLISALDNADLRTTIAKAASPNHLRMLDTVRELFSAPVTVNWPGTNAAALSSAPEFVQTQPGFDTAARHICNFVLGRSVPIPLPEDYEGSQRKFNFKEARSICFKLLANPSVQRCLGAQMPNECTNSAVTETTKLNSTEPQGETYGSRQETVPHHFSEQPQDPSVISTSHESHGPCRSEEPQSTPNVMAGIGRPVGGTFNFLQASKVMSPEPELDYSPVQMKHQPTMPTDADSVSVHSVDPPAIVPSACDFHEPKEDVYALEPENFEDTPPPAYPGPVEHAHATHLSDVDVDGSVSSKPASYADLFRRHGQGNQADGHADRNVRRAERVHVPPSVAEMGDTRPVVDTEHYGQTSTRGRGADYRGGRSHPGRGYSRGFMNGSTRRPFGGPRIGRGGGAHPGRGRANPHGPRANVAQA